MPEGIADAVVRASSERSACRLVRRGLVLSEYLDGLSATAGTIAVRCGADNGPRETTARPGVAPPSLYGALRQKGGMPMHAPGHLREGFHAYVDAGLPDDYVIPADYFRDGEQRSTRWLLGRLWHCSDVMP